MKTILEYILNKDTKISKIGSKKPVEGCSIEDICDWLEYNGVNDKRTFEKSSMDFPDENGKLLYVIGPDTNGNKSSEYWVSIRNYNHQQITIKPKDQSFFVNSSYVKTKLGFNKAIILAEEMINNPNKEIKIQIKK